MTAANLQMAMVPFTTGIGIELGNPHVAPAFSHFIKVSDDQSERRDHNGTLIVNNIALLPFSPSSLDFVVMVGLEDPTANLSSHYKLLKDNGYMVFVSTTDLLATDFLKTITACTNKFDVVLNQTYPGGCLTVIQKLTMSLKNSVSYTINKPKPAKTACVVRYGAYGDQMQASSVYHGLKEQGYHVTVLTQNPGAEVIKHDPNIDRLIVTTKDQVPNQHLSKLFDHLATQYDLFVNLCEASEGNLLAMKGRSAYNWTTEARHALMNHNYVEMQHKLAGLPHKPVIKFYPTAQEQRDAQKYMSTAKPFVMISLSGSSVHKVNAQLDYVIRYILDNTDKDIVLVGGPDTILLESGWESEPRVWPTCGKWSIRQTFTMIEYADLIIGPETGVLNAAAMLQVPKIVYLSHSTVENLTRDWINTISIVPPTSVPCYPCHKLHHGWDTCHRDEVTGTALCQSSMNVDDTYRGIDKCLGIISRTSNKENPSS